MNVLTFQVAELRSDNFDEIINIKEEQIASLENQLEAIRNELEAKEALVTKLTSVSVDDDLEPGAILKRRGSIRRRNSVRRGSRPAISITAKSSEILNAGESAGDLAAEKRDTETTEGRWGQHPSKKCLAQDEDYFVR